MYPCEIPGCTRTVVIRSRIRQGDHKGLMACPLCSSKANPKPRKSKPIKKISEKGLARRKERSAIRDEYFDYHIPLITHSEESLKRIYNPSRANCCHILPKSRHPSLQGNLENIVYLTLDEHARFDYLLDTLQLSKLEIEFPRSWPKVCERLKKLLPICEERTKLSFKLKEHIERR